MSICKFCLKEKRLVKAHIIPRAFFEAIKTNKKRDESLKKITNSKGIYPEGNTITGEYDPDLVCFDCEQRFGPFDEHAINVLLKNEGDNMPRHIDGKTIAWTVQSYEYKKMMLFFISLLWRADKTDLPFFSRVDIGSYADIAKDALLKQNDDDIERFSVFLARYNAGYGRSPLLDPYPERLDGINVYHFYLGSGYLVHIKVDKRPFSALFDQFKLSPSMFLILNRGKFENSQDLVVMQKMYKDAEQLKLSYTKSK